MKLLASLLLTSVASFLIATPVRAQYAMTCTREYNSSVNLRNQPSTRAGLENVDATVKLVTWIKHFNVSKLTVQS